MSPRSIVPTSRRSLLLGAAAVAPLVALGAGSASAASPGDFRNAAGLRMIDGSPWINNDTRTVDFRFDTDGQVRIFNPSVRVTVPASYADNPDKRYPVLLLLHGGMGFYQDWGNHGGVVEQTEEHEVIVVMPDGGAGSFYSNANFPQPGRTANWETFIMEQVLPFVHENFRTAPDRMAIAGLSMGGWGALALGQRYHGHFRSVSSYSGPADCGLSAAGKLVGALIVVAPLGDAVRYGANINYPGATWGSDLYPEIARGYNPLENIETYRGKRVFLRTGDGPLLSSLGFGGVPEVIDEFARRAGQFGLDFQENTVMHTQIAFHDALTAAGVDSDFRIDEGSTHEWSTWRRAFSEDLPGMMKALDA